MYGNQINPVHHTYDIETILGSGGSGVIYKARHKRLNMHVVLKELKNGINRTVAAQRNEVEALKSIRNMHIPLVYDFYSDSSGTYTVMEYIDGTSFDKLLVQGTVFTAAQAGKWYLQLACALESLHSKDICHRDIKPANIILTQNDDVVLIDFNSALVKGNNTHVINRSMGYASPEQEEYFKLCLQAHNLEKSAQSQKEIDSLKASPVLRNINWKLSDIYSLGATMYHLLTGRRLKLTESVIGYMSQTDIYTQKLAAVIECSTRSDPLERYSSASRLRRELLLIGNLS